MAASERDKEIGENVASLREGRSMSQKELGEHMRSRGHRWSQATVWAVEQGERPLKLTEGLDLAEVLGETLDGLVWERVQGHDHTVAFWQAMLQQVVTIREAARNLYDRLYSLEQIVRQDWPESGPVTNGMLGAAGELGVDPGMEAVAEGRMEWARSMVMGLDDPIGLGEFDDEDQEREARELVEGLQKRCADTYQWVQQKFGGGDGGEHQEEA